jgi:hypothetical protein
LTEHRPQTSPIGAASPLARRRGWCVIGLVVALAAAGLAARPLLPSTKDQGRAASSGTVAGILEASSPYFSTERASGFGEVTLTVAWTQAEPTRGHFSSSYAATVNAEITKATKDGLKVSLDIGLQYPPQWVFRLAGGTRFVNQYGEAFTGSAPSGNDVANAVTDSAVRRAEGVYLHWAGQHIGRGRIQSVREGGGPFGELRYPGPDYDGHTNCWWAYDTSSQNRAALRYRPGQGTVSAARAFLDEYDTDLTDYGVWLNDQIAGDFTVPRLLLLPGWGERPGGAAGVVSSRLGSSPAEFNEGLDWPQLIARLAHRATTVLYTTYLDAPMVRRTVQLEDPIAYLTHLDAGRRSPLGGENTGGGSNATVALILRRAAQYRLVVVNWMDQAQLVGDRRAHVASAPTFATYAADLRRYLRG